MNTEHEDGRILQSKIFDLYHSDTTKEHFFKIPNGENLNQFLREENVLEIHKIVRLSKYEILIFYYTIPEICNLCGKYKKECECK